jgi:hypothetical protein
MSLGEKAWRYAKYQVSKDVTVNTLRNSVLIGMIFLQSDGTYASFH